MMIENIFEYNKDKINQFYDDASSKYEIRADRVHWNNDHTQKNRFDALLNIGVKNGDTILDFGCGLGGLYEYILKKRLKINYIGVDINKNYIDDNIKYFDIDISNLFYKDSVKFYHINDITNIKENFDWFIASGVFTIELNIDDIVEIIKIAYNKSRKGLSFNLLRTEKIEYETTLFNGVNMTLYNPNYVYNIFNDIYNNVELITDYLYNDFTIYIKK